MNAKALATGLFLVLAAAGVVYVLMGGGDDAPEGVVPAQVDAEALPADGVVVYYFHGNKRCMTCNKMEALAAEVIYDEFGEHLRGGTVVFRSVNIETDATRHFVTDFAMTNRCVVMSLRRDGQQVDYHRLDGVWEKISDDAAYTAYIAENLTASLAQLGLDAG